MDVSLAATFFLVSWQCVEVFSDQCSNTQFIRGLHYNMYSSAGKLFTINASSREKCATLSIDVVNCTSTLYDSSNGNCTFYQGILPTSTNILPSNVHFLVNKERYCTWRGFKYSQTYDVCYLLDKSWSSYGNTKGFCKRRKSSLIRIDTAKKQRFIESSIHDDGPTNYYFVSGKRRSSGQWYFTDGPAISTFYWATNQRPYSPYFNCLFISTKQENRWVNFVCHTYYDYIGKICEMDIKSLIQ